MHLHRQKNQDAPVTAFKDKPKKWTSGPTTKRNWDILQGFITKGYYLQFGTLVRTSLVQQASKNVSVKKTLFLLFGSENILLSS